MEKIKVSDLVKQLEEESSKDQRNLSELVATMLVNFGEEGKVVKGLVNQSQSPLGMFINIIEYYIEKQK